MAVVAACVGGIAVSVGAGAGAGAGAFSKNNTDQASFYTNVANAFVATQLFSFLW